MPWLESLVFHPFLRFWNNCTYLSHFLSSFSINTALWLYVHCPLSSFWFMFLQLNTFFFGLPVAVIKGMCPPPMPSLFIYLFLKRFILLFYKLCVCCEGRVVCVCECDFLEQALAGSGKGSKQVPWKSAHPPNCWAIFPTPVLVTELLTPWPFSKLPGFEIWLGRSLCFQ